MRWLDGITKSMGMILSKLWEMLQEREAWHAAVHGLSGNQTWLSNWTTIARDDIWNGTFDKSWGLGETLRVESFQWRLAPFWEETSKGLLTSSFHEQALNRGHMRTQQEGSHLQARKRIFHASTLISDFHPPKVLENKFLLFKPPRSFVVCSVAQSCPTLCNPMDCCTPGFPVLHYHLWFVQTHVHWVGNAIQPTHSLSLPSPPALNLFQH